MCSSKMTGHIDAGEVGSLAIGSDESTQDRIDTIVRAHPVVLFIKGNLAQPRCGFSAASLQVLERYDVPLHAVDVLADEALRQGIKLYTDWPTIPQLYVDAVFVGGHDILRAMHAEGSLAGLLAPHRRRPAAAA